MGTPNPTLIQCLIIPCKSWAKSLWHKIQLISSTQNYWQRLHHFSGKQCIHQSSRTRNTCLDHPFTNKTMVGRRHCPRTCHQSVFQASWSIWSPNCSQLLATVCCTFPNHHQCQTKHLHVLQQSRCYCANQQLPTSTCQPQSHTVWWVWTLPCHSFIHQSLISFAIKYIHILGHQDQWNKNKPLSLKAQLKIDCNAAASQLHMQLQADQYLKLHLFIPMAHPHLTLWGQHIICQVKQYL